MGRTDEFVVESRSSVQITRNAKGEAQVSVKLYDNPEFDDERLRELIRQSILAFEVTEDLLVELERAELEAVS